MMSATIAISHEEVQQRLQALGISQNAMARAIRKDPGHVSRVLRGIVTSAVVLRRIEAFLARAERRASRSLIQRLHGNSYAVTLTSR